MVDYFIKAVYLGLNAQAKMAMGSIDLEGGGWDTPENKIKFVNPIKRNRDSKKK